MKSFYPSNILCLSQSYNQGNHKAYWNGANVKNYPFDETYGDSKKSGYLLAPFDCKVVKKYVKAGTSNGLWLTSIDKVDTPTGKAYVTLMINHISSNELNNIVVGKTYKQFEKIVMESNVGNATGYHHHIAVGFGTMSGDGWVKNNKGKWVLTTTDGTRKPEEAFYVHKEKTTIKNQQDLKFIVATDDVLKYTKGTYGTLADVRVRTGAGTNYPQKKVKDLTKDGQKNATSKNLNDPAYYKKGTVFDVLEVIYNSDTDVWARGYSGYINIQNGKYINCEKIK